MTPRRGFAFYVFSSVLAVSIATTIAVSYLSWDALEHDISGALLATSREMLKPTDPLFIQAQDRIVRNGGYTLIYIGAFSALAAAIVAFFVARMLSRPLADLEESVDALAQGDHERRAVVTGPKEIASIAEAFNHMADSVVQSEELRKRLVADVAHELRNPLGAALAQAEGMVDGILPTDKARVQSLVDDLRHVSVIVEDLRELAAADSGNLPYTMELFDLSAIVEQHVKRVTPRLSDDIALSATGVDGPIMVEGDVVRIQQVLRNLLYNARDHTSYGSITIVVDASPDMVTLRVDDTGDGIPAEALPHIFERMYRADDARSAATGGAGLGLAISNSIVRRHGGEMFASSEPGHGASVGFTIPRRQPDSARQPASAGAA